VIREERDSATTWLILDRPERLNAFDAAGYRELRMTLQRVEADEAVKVVVLTGQGRAFCAGADRSLLDRAVPGAERRVAGYEFAKLLDILAAFQKPLFAAVNGVAVGFGATMLLYCDVILIAETARLRLPFTAMGIVPEAGSSALLPARTRLSDATWAMLSSEWIDAETAQQMGFAWRVIPDVDLIAETSTAAAVIAALDATAVSATKRLITKERRDVARMAIQRETSEMALLFNAPPNHAANSVQDRQ
jgi:enoyl-CoA hydratase/carnithine racemase